MSEVIIDSTNYISHTVRGSLMLDYIKNEIGSSSGSVHWVTTASDGGLSLVDEGTGERVSKFTLQPEMTVYVDVDPLLSDSPHRRDLYKILSNMGIPIIVVLSADSILALVNQRLASVTERGHEKTVRMIIERASTIVVTSHWSEKIIRQYYRENDTPITVARLDYMELLDCASNTKESGLMARAPWHQKNLHYGHDIEGIHSALFGGRINKLSYPNNEIIEEYWQSRKLSVSFSDRLLAVARNSRTRLTNGTKKLQHVLISIRPDNAARCLVRNRDYTDFVKSFLVVTRPDMVAIMKKKLASLGADVTVLNEANILGGIYSKFQEADHAKRNLMLRTALIASDYVEEDFIMLDDDNLALDRIPLEYFVQQPKRYNAYYFDDLYRWHRSETSYDKAQQGCLSLLSGNNTELLIYSSHMPQVINKKIYIEMIKNLKIEDTDVMLDEWSPYFNYLASYYPHLISKRVYEVCGWPAHPNDWTPTYWPTKFRYLNYYPETDNGLSDVELINRQVNRFSRYRYTSYINRNVGQSIDQELKAGGVTVRLSNLKDYYAAEPDVILWQDIWVDVPTLMGDELRLDFVSVNDTKSFTLHEGRNDLKVPIHIANYGKQSQSITLFSGEDASSSIEFVVAGVIAEDIEGDIEIMRSHK